MWALAEERGDSVMAGSTMVTGCTGTVVDVLTAVVTRPAVHTDTVVAPVCVVACASILAGIGHQLTFIHIFCAVLASVMRRTLAVIGVYSIHTDATILTVVSRTVVNVVFTVWSCKAWQAAAVIGGVSLLDTCASILARRRVAWHVEGLTVLPTVLLRAAAVVGTHLIDTHTPVLTWRGQLGTFVDILFASFTMEGWRTRANECSVKGRALATIGTRIGGTWVGNVAYFSRPARWTAASVRREGDEVTRSSIATWGTHAGMIGRCKAKTVGETQPANAAEIKSVAMGNGPAFTTITARRWATWARVLAPVAYVVTGTLALSISI